MAIPAILADRDERLFSMMHIVPDCGNVNDKERDADTCYYSNVQ